MPQIFYFPFYLIFLIFLFWFFKEHLFEDPYDKMFLLTLIKVPFPLNDIWDPKVASVSANLFPLLWTYFTLKV